MREENNSILKDYLEAFRNRQELFIVFYAEEKDKNISRTELTRGEFWSLAKKAAGG